MQCQAGRLAQRTRRFLDTLHPKQPQAASKHMHTTAQRLLPLTTLIPCWLVHVGLSVMWLLGFAASLLTSLTVDSECLNQSNLLQLQLAMSDRSLMLPLPKAQPSGISLRSHPPRPSIEWAGSGGFWEVADWSNPLHSAHSYRTGCAPLPSIRSQNDARYLSVHSWFMLGWFSLPLTR